MDPLVIGLLIFGLIVAAVVVYGYSLPERWEVSERVQVGASAEALYDYLFTIRNWEQWTIWNREENPAFEFHYEGPASGCGATQCWKARKQSGKTKICSGTRPEKIEFLFSFGQGHHMMKGKLEFEPKGGETEVTWSARGNAGSNPTKRILAKMFRPYVQKDFQRGLKRLKSIMESGMHEISPN